MPDAVPEAAALLSVMRDAASAVHEALKTVTDLGPSGRKEGQYALDLVADTAVLEVLGAAGLPVVSEESGHTGRPEGRADGVVVVVDPVDGSTNASRGIPWFNTSLCAVDAVGPLAAVVLDHGSGAWYEASRGGGAFRNGEALSPAACEDVADAVVALNGYPARPFGWKQFRALGAAALDLCAVASGMLDAYVDCTSVGLGPWDYLGGMLICAEAGAAVGSVEGLDLVTTDASARRILVAAATPSLAQQLLGLRRELDNL